MYSCVTLNKKRLKKFSILNEKRKLFNELNENFFDYYNTINFTKQFFLSRSVKLLYTKDELTGYIWFSKYDDRHYVINSMYINGQQENLIKGFRELIESLKPRAFYTYYCEKNSINFSILEELGFYKRESTYIMCLNTCMFNNISVKDSVDIEPFKKGLHEQIRCNIQNEVFKNDSRIPLGIEDIYYDESQKYYYDEGSIFIKKDNEYIGYGQIIIDGDIPTIVNIGVIEGYRGKGYGRFLVESLIRIVIINGFKKVNLKVSANNSTALNLYRSLGFKIQRETCKWELRR
ncbi:GNAT family N-acetyltransferase [Clostridium sp. YIM B02515]|uniref:GNAT family N-acetyltransferase n=1 Tax=Clostridium rhizosphaerae TaxID=2803861 RepID=A0ABS1T684_9CLOT|nr:GNAT family N-acetyltransferase [Clostridium rhizosphaerae]MBL4934859.1 GNAT family N-acetyltransferase [Clostridium rhizosphaerae]